MAADPVRVLLVDEDSMLRHGVRALLEGDAFEVIGEAVDAGDAVTQAITAKPDVVVMAVMMRATSGIEAARRLRQAGTSAPILMLTNSTDPVDAEGALRAGACGYVLKDDPPKAILAAIRAAARGDSPLSPRIAAGLLARLLGEPVGDGSAPDLTARELHVLRLLAVGRRNAEIAEELSISAYTVKRHVSNLLAKLSVENRTEAAVAATRLGLI